MSNIISKKSRYLFASVDSSPRVGGVSLLAKQMSRILAVDHGAESVYIGPKGTYFLRGEMPLKVYEDFQSETRLRAGPGSGREDERIYDLSRNLIQHFGLNTVIIWHPFYYGPGITKAAKSLGIKTAVFIHGTELTSQIPSVMKGQVNWTPDPNSELLPDRLFMTISRADLILTNSQFSKNLIRNLVPDTNVSVIGCGIDQSTLESEIDLIPNYNPLVKKSHREDLGLPEKRTLIHVGRLVPHKNQSLSIELISKIDNTQLLIVGDGPKKSTLQQQSEQLNLTDRIFFLGEIDEKAKWQYLRASDAGFLISEFDDATGGYEGFGITMIEYTAAGAAVISNGQHGMSDFAVRYEGAFNILDTTDGIEHHAAKLDAFLNNSAEVSAQVEKARAVTRMRFTWQHVARRAVTALEAIDS